MSSQLTPFSGPSSWRWLLSPDSNLLPRSSATCMRIAFCHYALLFLGGGFSSPSKIFVTPPSFDRSAIHQQLFFCPSFVRSFCLFRTRSSFNQYRWLQGPEDLQREQPLFTTPSPAPAYLATTLDFIFLLFLLCSLFIQKQLSAAIIMSRDFTEQSPFDFYLMHAAL